MAELLIAMGIMSPEVVAGTAGAAAVGPEATGGLMAMASNAKGVGSMLGPAGLGSAEGLVAPSVGGLIPASQVPQAGGMTNNPIMQAFLKAGATSLGSGLGSRVINSVLPTAQAMPMMPSGGGALAGSSMMNPSARAAQLTQSFVLPHNQPQQGSTMSPEILAILAEALKRRQGGG